MLSKRYSCQEYASYSTCTLQAFDMPNGVVFRPSTGLSSAERKAGGRDRQAGRYYDGNLTDRTTHLVATRGHPASEKIKPTKDNGTAGCCGGGCWTARRLAAGPLRRGAPRPIGRSERAKRPRASSTNVSSQSRGGDTARQRAQAVKLTQATLTLQARVFPVGGRSARLAPRSIQSGHSPTSRPSRSAAAARARRAETMTPPQERVCVHAPTVDRCDPFRSDAPDSADRPQPHPATSHRAGDPVCGSAADCSAPRALHPSGGMQQRCFWRPARNGQW